MHRLLLTGAVAVIALAATAAGLPAAASTGRLPAAAGTGGLPAAAGAGGLAAAAGTPGVPAAPAAGLPAAAGAAPPAEWAGDGAGHEPSPGLGPAPAPDPALLAQCTGTAPITCTYDVPPGHYDVTVFLGGDQPAETEVYAEARRLMVDRVDTPAGERARRTFTVNVRNPEGQQNAFAGPGNPGLTLTFAGPAPHVSGIGLARAGERPTRLFLAGDSTVTDQETAPYTGWGQRLPRHFRHGISVVNHSGSGESSVSFLAKPELWAAMEPQLRPGDVVLVQVAHNDKQTTAEQYRANLRQIVTGIRSRGATPVLVTPIVRRWFTGTKLNSTGLIVNGLGVDLPAEMRSVATTEAVALIDLTARSQTVVEALGPEAAKSLYLTREKRDDTHTSEYGATVFADLVATDLADLDLLPDRSWT